MDDFIYIRKLSNNPGKFSSELTKMFNQQEDCFKFILSFLFYSNELANPENNQFIIKVLTEFKKYLFGEKDIFSILGVDLQIEAFYILLDLKDDKLIKLIIDCFNISSSPVSICPLILQDFQERPNRRNKCVNLILKLHFLKYFSMEDILIPLFLQDNMNLVELYLDSCIGMRIEFVTLLDKIIGMEVQLSDLMRDNVKLVTGCGQKTPKILAKVCLRLIKKYKLDYTLFPNVLNRQQLSSARYLFQKRYVDNELSEISFFLFLKDICHQLPKLKTEILECFIDYNDMKAASKFINLIKAHQNEIPEQVSYALDQKCEKGIDLSTFIFRERKTNYYKLNLSIDSIFLIDSSENFEFAIENLCNSDVIGLDSEWKPSFQSHEEEKLALFQIATLEKIYLFDMINLPLILNDSHWDKMGSLFSNERIEKLCYGFASDQRVMKSFNIILSKHLKGMKKVYDFNRTKKIMDQHIPNIFPYKPNNNKGLCELVCCCFGKPLDKREQCSYWALRPLTSEQVQYASIDAFCLLELNKFFNAAAGKRSLSNWKELKFIPEPVKHKKIESPQTSSMASTPNKNHINRSKNFKKKQAKYYSNSSSNNPK